MNTTQRQRQRPQQMKGVHAYRFFAAVQQRVQHGGCGAVLNAQVGGAGQEELFRRAGVQRPFFELRGGGRLGRRFDGGVLAFSARVRARL